MPRGIYQRTQRPIKPTEDRFWSKVNKNGPVVRPEIGACWIWTAYLDPDGYGRIGIGQRAAKSQRVAWVLAHGEIPVETPHVLHRCDNPPCVNPSHLFLGTQRDNMRDCRDKSRHRCIRPEVLATLSSYREKLAGKRRAQTHCKRGHELAGENLRIYRGCRNCRACAGRPEMRAYHREYQRKYQKSYKARKRAQLTAVTSAIG